MHRIMEGKQQESKEKVYKKAEYNFQKVCKKWQGTRHESIKRQLRNRQESMQKKQQVTIKKVSRNTSKGIGKKVCKEYSK